MNYLHVIELLSKLEEKVVRAKLSSYIGIYKRNN